MTQDEIDQLFGQEHVEHYRQTGGEGHDWKGTVTLLLTTTGRKSGEERTAPLIYQPWEDAYLIVASNGGADAPPAWYRNIEEDPKVTLQVEDDVFEASARDATEDEHPDMWRQMTSAWPDYDEYPKKTDRPIPVVVLERA